MCITDSFWRKKNQRTILPLIHFDTPCSCVKVLLTQRIGVRRRNVMQGVLDGCVLLLRSVKTIVTVRMLTLYVLSSPSMLSLLSG